MVTGVLLGGLLWLAAPPAGRANLVLSVNAPQQVAQGGTGFIEVLLTNSSATDSVVLSSFQFDISVSGTGVQFTSATDGTLTAAYVFGTHGSGDVTFDSLPATALNLSDFYLDPPFSTTLAPGATYGIARLGFQVDGSAPVGARDITFSNILFYPSDIGDPYSQDLITAEPAVGGIEVLQGEYVIPGPPTALLAVVGGVCGLVGRRLTLKRRVAQVHRERAVPPLW